MALFLRRLWTLSLAVVLLMPSLGCSKREHTKVRMEQERQESEVVEDKPGEMIVE